MDVRCPQCQTLYELDSSQLKSKVVTLKCSQCQHVFRFESNSKVVQENQRRWMVRNLDSGDVHYLSSFDVLHQWIMEGKVTRNDEISRTGDKWTLLEEIGEFMPIFQVVDSISSIAAGSAKAKSSSPDKEVARAAEADQAAASTQGESSSPLPPSPHAPADPGESNADPDESRERVPTSIQYGGASADEEITQIERPLAGVSSTASSEGSQPAPQHRTAAPESSARAENDVWEFGSEPATYAQPEVDSGEIELPGRSRWPAILIVLVVLAAGAGFYFVNSTQPEWWTSLVSSEDTSREVVAIGDPDTGVAEEDETIDPATLIAGALDNALSEVNVRHEELFSKAVAASRPGMDRALGVATEEAEAWADGAALDDILTAARRDLERGRHRQALGRYQEVLGHDSRNVNAIVGKGWVYLEQSRSAAAVDEFKRALEIDSNNGDAYIGLGSAERQRGRLEEAFRAYDLYLGRHPKGPKASIARYQLDQLRKQLGR